MAVFALTVHATYRCGHSGACCRTPWDVPVEAPARAAIEEGVAAGRLPGVVEPFVHGVGLPDGAVAVLGRDAGGACVFLQADRLCAVHRALGEAALPATCRIFPRIALTDSRGTFITLSHYCPTAARALLDTGTPLEIVSGPPAFPAGDYEGLDATEAWPPTLRRGVLLGLDGYAGWEQRAVALLGASDVSAVAVLAQLARDVGVLEAWRPGGPTLLEAVAALPVMAPTDGVASAPARDWAWPRAAAVEACVPADLAGLMDEAAPEAGWALVARGWAAVDRPARAYLAAHAFANWTAYEGDGLRVWMASVEAALAVLVVACARRCAAAAHDLDGPLFVEAVRQADLLLRHLASREALLRVWTGGSAPQAGGSAAAEGLGRSGRFE